MQQIKDRDRQRVIIESPFSGDILENLRYLDECILDSINRGEAPFASHKMYPGALRESIPGERLLGIELGYSWWPGAAVVFYLDRGLSSGMTAALRRAIEFSHPHSFRTIFGPISPSVSNILQSLGASP